jgi:hypothetical protein
MTTLTWEKTQFHFGQYLEIRHSLQIHYGKEGTNTRFNYNRTLMTY